ncbi:MAG: NACHT domain-containing protein [Cyanothece sp. SIO1E1]|nr:NACHT domain-containing protein [Cyanothece sp. SIO1E1]
MLEWLTISTGIGLSKLVLEQVLDLGKPVLEGYVQDFFRDCLEGGVAQLNAALLKTPMAEAIGFFIKRFVKELQFNDVPETSIEHHYRGAIKQFVQNQAVRPILGKAFETGCKQIDYAQLEHIWAQQYQQAGWQFPTEEFDWRGVAREYVVEVKGIIKANSELRSLLTTELLEAIAQNTTHISPGFDIAKYRESLQCSYGYLKLYTLDSTDRVDAIKLWSMFIQQTVREALPPMRYELPLDLKRKLQEEGQLGDDLSPEALEHYRLEYFQQPAQKVLEAVADSQRAVILGDPGAGKSTLLQYLALEWVEGNTEPLPLLIELREYVLAQSTHFLEFLHHGRGADWQFDQQQLHQHLLEKPTLVMFDGLDEVFDRPTQSTVIDDIIRFAQQYPQVQVLVTSRIIGYNPERFQHAGFHQFTIQPLDEAEVHEFIDRWYDLAMGSDLDKTRLKGRLKDAIANSKAIQNLADNPLLLTMMAILNRRQELPRDRADLYDQASRVLLYHWDVDYKRLQLPLNAIGRREKQEILRLIAYEMQAGDEGLKGNLISAERLTQILTNYLRDQDFSESREKANLLIQQLRERNFILCYSGADTYGFVHRTFLEYFCAVEIVQQFEKQQILSFEQLRDQVFGQHWQDKTWHEVLQLICGMLDVKFVLELTDYLMNREDKNKNSMHFLIASKCFAELKNQSGAKSIYLKLLNLIFSNRGTFFHWRIGINIDEVTTPIFHSNISNALLTVLESWQNQAETIAWLEEKMQICMQFDVYKSGDVAAVIVQRLAKIKAGDPKIIGFLKTCIQSSKNYIVQATALCELVQQQEDHSDILSNLVEYALSNEGHFVRWISIHELGRVFKKNAKVFEVLCNCANHDPFIRNQFARREGFINPRQVAIYELATLYPEHPTTLRIIRDKAETDPDWQVRCQAIEKLNEIWEEEVEKIEFLKNCTLRDPFMRDISYDEDNPRQIALDTLITNYPDYPKILDLLRDRAANDSDDQLRQWAQKQLEKLKIVQGGRHE